eukprot:279409-Prorocentrum_minimum.AAC.1
MEKRERTEREGKQRTQREVAARGPGSFICRCAVLRVTTDAGRKFRGSSKSTGLRDAKPREKLKEESNSAAAADTQLSIAKDAEVVLDAVEAAGVDTAELPAAEAAVSEEVDRAGAAVASEESAQVTEQVRASYGLRIGRGRPVLPAAQRWAACPVDHPYRGSAVGLEGSNPRRGAPARRPSPAVFGEGVGRVPALGSDLAARLGASDSRRLEPPFECRAMKRPFKPFRVFKDVQDSPGGAERLRRRPP